MELKSFLQKIKEAIVPIVVIGAVILVSYIFKLGCPLKFVTGISCPGCGMTRAYLSLLHGDVKGAFFYHPLFFVLPLALVVYWARSIVGQRKCDIIMAILILSLLILYVYRMFCSDGSVVSFDPQSGLIFRIIKMIGGIKYVL